MTHLFDARCCGTQCRKAGAIDAAALGPFKKQAHGHGRENEKSLLYFGCDFSGRYNFGKIIKIVATRFHILELKCVKFDFGWASAPKPAGEAYSAPPDTLAGFITGPTSNGKKGRERERESDGKERA